MISTARRPVPVRPSGFALHLSAVEVITRTMCGALFQLARDPARCASFRAPSRPCFPALTARTRCVRQGATLWPLPAALPRRLGWESRQAADLVHVLAPLPLPVYTSTRGGRRDHCGPGQVDDGYDAATPRPSYGVKLGGRITRGGLLTHSPLLAARPHDLQGLATLGDDYAGGIMAADKGCVDQSQQARLAQPQGLHVVTPPRARRTPTQPHSFVRVCARWRPVVETVGSQGTEHFAVARLRVRDRWHCSQRLMRKVWAHTVGVLLNLQMGRQPLALDGILTV